MTWTDDALYARSLARDASLDGQYFMAVRTTGIYCLLSCTARKPRRENVCFFQAEAEAREAGFRPCRRCRPDAFGEARALDALEVLLERLHGAPEAFRATDDLAAALGCGGTALASRFRRHGLPSPAQVLTGARVERLAKALAASPASILDLALDAGFESLSTAHAQCLRRLGLSPGAWRRLGQDAVLQLPRDYRRADTLAFHGRDPHSACERVAGTTLHKGLEVDGRPVRVILDFRDGEVQVAADHPLQALWGSVRRMLGLHLDPGPFERGLDPAFAALVAPRAGLRLPQTADAWEALVWAILGQQVNLAFAYALRRDLVARFGPPLGDGLWAHPGAARLAQADPGDLTALRLSRAKAETLVGAARAVASGALDLERLRGGTATRAEGALRALKGVGPWTARYVLLRGLGFGDAVPVGDAGLTLALQRFHGLDHRPDPAETEALLAPFAPHRSLAVFHLWASLKGTPA